MKVTLLALLSVAALPAFALTAEEEQQYLAGAGMGYAKAAELNQYPGPMHALELADQLELTAEQRGTLKALMDAHKAEARQVGKRLVQAERELDLMFRAKTVDAQALRAKVAEAGAIQSEYRLTHLETHRRTRALLTPKQIVQYDALRGYAKEAQHKHGH